MQETASINIFEKGKSHLLTSKNRPLDFFSLDAVKSLYTTTATNPTPYNITPFTGRTGVSLVPPNSYPFYSEREKFKPKIQSDGGQLSEWSPMYNPSKEQAEIDRAAAVVANIPHGYIALGGKNLDTNEPMIELTVISEIHEDDEYGSVINPVTKKHNGGPFVIKVPISMRVDELRRVIRDRGGIIPALCRLSYAGKHFEDGNRTLQHYGVAFWNQRFPHWPLKIITV
jgi:hypothetical protein